MANGMVPFQGTGGPRLTPEEAAALEAARYRDGQVHSTGPDAAYAWDSASYQPGGANYLHNQPPAPAAAPPPPPPAFGAAPAAQAPAAPAADPNISPATGMPRSQFSQNLHAAMADWLPGQGPHPLAPQPAFRPAFPWSQPEPANRALSLLPPPPPGSAQPVPFQVASQPVGQPLPGAIQTSLGPPPAPTTAPLAGPARRLASRFAPPPVPGAGASGQPPAANAARRPMGRASDERDRRGRRGR